LIKTSAFSISSWRKIDDEAVLNEDEWKGIKQDNDGYPAKYLFD
jgi:hypothetical protein